MPKGRSTSGTGNRSTAGTTAIIAAPGASARLVVRTIDIAITVAAQGSFVAITDGTTTYLKWDSGSIRDIPHLDFGPNGLPLAKNGPLNLVVSDGDATVYMVATAEILGET